ncbi:MAG: ATP-binding protein [Acidobacteriota bacterium]
MEDLSLHILDIVENSITAGARNMLIIIREDSKEDLLNLEIKDDGKGMDEEFVTKVMDPFVTTKEKEKKVGLGIALLNEAAKAAHGSMTVESRKGVGTIVRASFQLSHVDRKPLGNMKETLLCLLATYRGVDFTYEHQKGERHCRLNSGELREKAGEAALSLPEWIRFLKEQIKGEFEKLLMNASQ